MTFQKPLRVFQLECSKLDGDVSDLLLEKLAKVFKFYKSHIPQQYEEDLYLAMNFILWKYSLWFNGKCTLGQEMMGVRYINSPMWNEDKRGWMKSALVSSLSLLKSSLSSLITSSPSTKLSSSSLPLQPPSDKSTPPFQPSSSTSSSSTPPPSSSSLSLNKEIPRFKIIGMFLLNHIFPYFSSKNIHLKSSPTESSFCKDKIHVVIENINHFIKFLRIINFAFFLQSGKFPSLSERFFAVDYRSVCPISVNQGNFDLDQREALWEGCIEFLTLIIPAINFHKVVRVVKEGISRSTFRQTYNNTSRHTEPTNNDDTTIIQNNNDDDDVSKITNDNNISFNDDDDSITIIGGDNDEITISNLMQCSFCSDWPIQPHYSTCCRHVYCFYCVHRKIGEDDGYKCSGCGGCLATTIIPVPPISTHANNKNNNNGR